MKFEFRAIVGEAVIVAVVGFMVALGANKISGRGLDLSRNYFPGGTNTVPAKPLPPTVSSNSPATNEPSEADQITERLRDKGLQEVKRSQVEARFHDPRYREGRIIFVDARGGDGYTEGHIPGAYELDPYHPEKKLTDVLGICQAADEVVVYCTGGDCEDSDTTAILLRDAGVPVKKLFVYGGGITEWQDNHLPIETGARNSGALAQ